MFDKQDELCVNAIRMLSIDAIEKANSGHPGLPMDAAPMAYVLWTRYLKTYPKNPNWVDRDRFILSAGHGSALLYSLLHLSGYKVSAEDLQQFRQENSLTPGHPEYGHTDGVEATTGPLGQGLGMAVGMAMAEKHLAAVYNQPEQNIVDHHTYTIVGDGDLMEGISHEAASLAGHLKLGKLIVLYDSNDISLDGPTKMAFEDNTKKRFEGYGWQYLKVEDGNSLTKIDDALTTAKENEEQPTIIEIKTIIGYGSPDQGTNKVHGAPLGNKNIEETRKVYNWKYEPFKIPEVVYDRFHEYTFERHQKDFNNWNKLFKNYKQEHPKLAASFEAGFAGKINSNWIKEITTYHEGTVTEASRITGHKIISAVAEKNINFWGGSADLFSSNKTNSSNSKAFEADSPQERNIWFGVREFGQAAAINGIALHGGTRTYGSTFFVFSDYLRGALRLSALQHLPVTYIFTHDSIAVGEDGPTHEPIEHLMSLRAMPNINVIRPADPNEVIAAWNIALTATDTPTVLVLTRQGLPVLPKTDKISFEGVKRGAYILSRSKKNIPDGILIATGSEVSLAIEAQKQLKIDGIDVSVVSMPSFELFEKQSKDYQQQVLPDEVTNRMSIEMGSSLGWERYVGRRGVILGIDKFGASGNGPTLVNHYGFNVENVVSKYETAYEK
ncbi:transketolase [Ligilactobacillus sp. WILCCON 0076]|uniref:Transketolase n=1 Tax=Ligilactobacillus ubinensis TaxID=2876789 RepID=A0A9X2FLT4_9LACO|nr:transketolase [Ligilactobacillus ubinensis]MCP0888019.1 transketolase [Ligilactobacillus ubinensis]